jgi:RND family efflux transporter MFP subunit
MVPVEVDSIGTVAPFAAVAIKTRIDTTITSINFQDGARVNEGDVLLTLDARQIDAQIAQVQGTIEKDKAQLAGAQRDFNRYSELIAKGATPQTNVDNAKTQADVLSATILADTANLDNLKVQKSYTEIRAPISGRISAANFKVGNFVRAADTQPIATINQVAPIYVTFTTPQRILPDLRQAMTAGTAKITATMPNNAGVSETGAVAMIENAVDVTTGMVTVRAIMNNERETLWPGTLVNVRMTVREEESIVVPSVAVQRSQSGNFVFVAKDGKAVVQPVEVGRTFEGQSVIAKGLQGGESIVTDGQLLLSNGSLVEERARKAGA